MAVHVLCLPRVLVIELYGEAMKRYGPSEMDEVVRLFGHPARATYSADMPATYNEFGPARMSLAKRRRVLVEEIPRWIAKRVDARDVGPWTDDVGREYKPESGGEEGGGGGDGGDLELWSCRVPIYLKLERERWWPELGARLRLERDGWTMLVEVVQLPARVRAATAFVMLRGDVQK